MKSPFAKIIREAMDRTPGAIGGAFAAWDGETVDFVSEWEEFRWLTLTAHYGIVLSHVQAALHTYHFGEAETICLTHADLDIVVQSVQEGYFALLAVEKPTFLARAMHALSLAAESLREEMG